MTEMRPDGDMRTLTAASPERAEPAKYHVLSGFIPSGRRVNSVQSLPGLVPPHTSHRTYTMPPIRRAWQWVVSDSHRFAQPVSYSSWDTESYAAAAMTRSPHARCASRHTRRGRRM